MTEHLSVKEHHLEETRVKTIFGFWAYLMTDCILFGTLFATYIVLHTNTFGGPGAKELFSLPFALTETLILLTSSFTCTLSKLAAYRNDKNKVIMWFAVTFLLGVAFIAMELNEFSHLVHEGNSWRRSGFLTGFFTLVGTHGLHISTGLLWMIILIIPVFRHGLTLVSLKRLTCLRMFWHFLDIVWIFIFTIVYLMGAL
jgi:cytochrome o ubiquinol oxidase subunit 3